MDKAINEIEEISKEKEESSKKTDDFEFLKIFDKKSEKNNEFEIFDGKKLENPVFSLISPIKNDDFSPKPEGITNNSLNLAYSTIKVEVSSAQLKKSSNPFEEFLPNNENPPENPLNFFSNFNQINPSKNLTNFFMNTLEKTPEKPFEFVDNLMKLEEKNPFSSFASLKFTDSSKKPPLNELKTFDLL